MPDIYFIIVVLLFLLAISDLIVGVSNDAVNFLNSAIGSKVAGRQVIMIVASLGILAGASFSSGMMEVARKGVFNPEYFYFSEIMVIFIAVMLTDIILLDLFNTFGMPTSTTVSIVFELLGAAVAVASIKILSSGDSLNTLSNYINFSSAGLIISGIFISVFIAFLVGTFAQYISRLLFTFHIKKRILIIGALWSGLALTALTYFLLIKGMKGASFISDEFLFQVKNNSLLIMGGAFVFWSIVMQISLKYFRFNIFRVVVLFGTFALAMAFAGNDLVNFIGVPIAGFESYLAWNGSGTVAEEFSMSILNEPVRTETYLLMIAGFIMITTLWFSKKARSVTETEVNLGRQNEGRERFAPNAFAKGIVRYSLLLGRAFQKIIPPAWQNKAEESFSPVEKKDLKKAEDQPAFDLIRASVNLTVASVLIALATSLKLPLSTTYVSFMVAMGTSLADRAWGRNSAVYRVAGVLNVIGGWFFTAFLAFTAASVFAVFIYYGGIFAIGVLVCLVVFLVSRTFLHHRKKEKKKAETVIKDSGVRFMETSDVLEKTAEKVASTLLIIKTSYTDALSGLFEENRKLLYKAEQDILDLKTENDALKRQLYSLIKQNGGNDVETGRIYLSVYNLSQDILQSASLIVSTCLEHVENSLEPIRSEQSEFAQRIAVGIDDYLSKLAYAIVNRDFKNYVEIQDQKLFLLGLSDNHLDHQVEGIRAEAFGMRNSLLIFSIALETKDLVVTAEQFATLFRKKNPPNGNVPGHMRPDTVLQA